MQLFQYSPVVVGDFVVELLDPDPGLVAIGGLVLMVAGDLVVGFVALEEEAVVLEEGFVDLEVAGALVEAVEEALPPTIPSPSVSSSDWYCVLIHLCISVWFS